MRQRLLDATVECLVERGWSGTSTTLVSQRAGVSRGAQLHHFPTKNDLVLAAVEHLTEAAARGPARRRGATCRPGRRRTRAVLEMLADHFTGPVFSAALELWVAARTDESLREAVGPLEQRIGRETHRSTVELLGVDESEPGVRELVQATLDLVRGLGLANTITDDAARRGRILDQWAAVLDAQRRSRSMNDAGSTAGARRPGGRGRPARRAGRPASTTPGWRTPTPAAGWDVAHQVAHLAWTDEVAVAAATDKAAWDALVLAALEDPEASSTTRRPRGAPRAAGGAAGPLAGRPRARWPRCCARCPRARSCRGTARR